MTTLGNFPSATSIATTDYIAVEQGGVLKKATPALLPFLSSGTGATATDLQTKLRRDLPSVFDYMTDAQKADAIAGTLLVDQTTAFIAAGNALQAGSIRGLIVPKYSYLLFKNGVTYTQAPINLSGLTGVTIFWDSPTLQLDTARSWLGASANFILADSCTDFFNIGGFYMTGPAIALDGTFTGVVAMHLTGDCRNVITPAMRINKAFAALMMDTPTSTGVVGIKVQPVDVTSCIYGVTGADSGSNMVIESLTSDGCGRGLFLYGVKHVKAWGRSKNPKFSADWSISTHTSGHGTVEDIEYNYTNTESNSANGRCVVVGHNNSDNVISTITDVRVHLNVKTNSSGLYSAFELEKVKLDGSPDTTDRGHTNRGLRISGLVDGAPSSGAAVQLGNVGSTWGASENIYDVTLCDLRIVNNPNSPSIDLKLIMPSLKGPLTINNVWTQKQIDIWGAASPATYAPTSADARVFVQSSSSSNMDVYETVNGVRVIAANSSPVTVQPVYSGLSLTNYGAGGTVTYNMPAATAGLGPFSFVRINAQAMRVDPNGIESFNGGGGLGKYKSIDSDGGSFDTRCQIAATWDVTRSNGTLSNEP